MNDPADLARVLALLRERKLPQAEAACREILAKAPRNAAALHLLALVRKDAGDPAESEQLMRQSIELDPRNADFHANLANLLRGAGRLQDAERSYRAALAIDSQHNVARFGLVRALTDLQQYGAAEAESRALLAARGSDPQAWIALARILREQNRLGEAETAYHQALAAKPDYGAAHHNLGSLLAGMERSEEALAALTRAEQLGVSGFELAFNRGRVLMQLYRIEEAEAAFARAVALNPHHGEAHLNLARVKFMRADPQFASPISDAAAQHPDDIALQTLHGRILWRGGRLQQAEAVFRDLITRHGPDPELRSALAQVLHESGRLREAEAEAMEAAIAKPNESRLVETLVVLLLARGRPDDALPFIRAQRARLPMDQGWIAYEATVARMLDQPLYHDLYDYQRLVRTYDLEAPPGWSSMEELNGALLTALNARHPFAVQPLDQSLMNGSQTARSLVTDPDPAIRAVLKAFEEPIADFRKHIGTNPAHPLSARNSGATQFSGAWSVQLRREGFHVNHFHPQGWISSAYYVAVPGEVHDVNLMSGWIKFGETRYPVPGVQPATFVKPRPGRLVLFPSYMWHGTNPIHGSEPRTTIAFDAVPKPGT